MNQGTVKPVAINNSQKEYKKSLADEISISSSAQLCSDFIHCFPSTHRPSIYSKNNSKEEKKEIFHRTKTKQIAAQHTVFIVTRIFI